MLRSRKVIAGRYYVNNRRKIVREVLSIKDKTVIFNTYHLDTGNSCGSPSECLIADFMRWAHHEAKPAELASLQYHRLEVLLRTPEILNQEELNHYVPDRAAESFAGETALQGQPS